MSSEMNAYALGHDELYSTAPKPEDYAMNYCGDFVFQKSTTKNMDKLWERFYKNDSYPAYYLGIATKIAICKCPHTGEEGWFNGKRCLSIENPEKGSPVTVTLKVLDKNYKREFLFMGWVNHPVHEWSMTKGSTLQLSQSFVDGLSLHDRRYLKMNH
jgi:hypothetical protein